MNCLQRQRGVTLSGLIFACVLVSVIALIGMKLFPLFNEKVKVDTAIANTAAQPQIGIKTNREIMEFVLRNFEISDVDRYETVPTLSKVMTIDRIKNSRDKQLHMAYEIRGPLFGPLDVILKYDNTVLLKGGVVE